jgi:hypothetical protein
MGNLDDRGQILLIGAVIMAISFIGLGIVLNGSLHTPTIAAQASDDLGTNDLTELREAIERETAALMEEARSRRGGDFTDQRDFVANNISLLTDGLRTYSVRDDTAVAIPPTGQSVSYREGHLVSGSFSGLLGDTADFDSQFRRFDIRASGVIGTFEVTVDGSSAPPRTIVVDDSEVRVGGQSCPYNQRISLTNASTDDDPACEALHFVQELEGDYEVRIDTGLLSNGNVEYEFVGEGNFGDSMIDASTELLYSTRVPVSIESVAMSFEGTIEVAPGEP